MLISNKPLTRLLFATTAPSVEADKETDEVYFQQLRLSLGIAEGSKEIQKGWNIYGNHCVINNSRSHTFLR